MIEEVGESQSWLPTSPRWNCTVPFQGRADGDVHSTHDQSGMESSKVCDPDQGKFVGQGEHEHDNGAEDVKIVAEHQ